MTIEFQFNSIIIQTGDMQENYPLMFSTFQQYLPTQKSLRRKKPKRNRETVASLIDALIDSIDSGSDSSG